MGLLGMEDFLCPLFFVCREVASTSITSPEFQRADLNRDGRGAEARKKSRNNSAALGQDPVPPQGIHIIISFSSSAELNSPANERC